VRLKLCVGPDPASSNEWEYLNSLEDAKQYLLENEIEELRINSQIGNDDEGGFKLIAWLQDRVKSSGYLPPFSIIPISDDLNTERVMSYKRDHIFNLVNNRNLLAGDQPIWVFLDDFRTVPRGWVLTQTPEETIELLKSGRVERLSLDYHLGLVNDENNNMRTGLTVLKWIEKEVRENGFTIPSEITVHSSDGVGRIAMQELIIRVMN